jgi:hypothetical protein
MFWLASCFSKIKKPNSHFIGNQCGIAGVVSRYNQKTDIPASLFGHVFLHLPTVHTFSTYMLLYLAHVLLYLTTAHT